MSLDITQYPCCFCQSYKIQLLGFDLFETEDGLNYLVACICIDCSKLIEMNLPVKTTINMSKLEFEEKNK